MADREDWTMRMSNSPDKGPLELLRLGLGRLRDRVRGDDRDTGDGARDAGERRDDERPDHEDWSMTMHNSPQKGPIEAGRSLVERLRAENDTEADRESGRGGR